MTGRQATNDINRWLAKGLEAALIYFVNQLKITLSVPVQRDSRGKRRYATRLGWRAATRATPGAPPRKITGRLRASITYEINATNTTGRAGTNVVYAPRQEYEYNHKFIQPTFEREADNIARIIGENSVV